MIPARNYRAEQICSITLCFVALGALWGQTGFLLAFKVAISVLLVAIIAISAGLYRGAR